MKKNGVLMSNLFQIWYFRVRPCWRCKRRIRLYTWMGKSLYDADCPSVGRPRWFLSVYETKRSRRYFANVCRHCGAIQGDWYLYHTVGGAFYGYMLPLRKPDKPKRILTDDDYFGQLYT